ncbi:hypothetical protein [Neobacillus drentensis]|uniref:hypothetical protein n=1 Tax=Neobacillus drentensis TaxID=220684 RepID=UPI00300311BB
MGKHVWKVRADFYQQGLNEGDIISSIEGRYKILNTAYRNQYGEFFLCEFLDDYQDDDTSSQTQKGIVAKILTTVMKLLYWSYSFLLKY